MKMARNLIMSHRNIISRKNQITCTILLKGVTDEQIVKKKDESQRTIFSVWLLTKDIEYEGYFFQDANSSWTNSVPEIVHFFLGIFKKPSDFFPCDFFLEWFSIIFS